MKGLSELSQLGARKAKLQQSKGNDTADKIRETAKGLQSGESEKSGESGSFDQELKDAAEKVEGYMIGFMVKQMRKTVKRTEGLFERGQAEKMFQSQLDDKLANRMASSRDFGIAESVYNQFSADQAP